MTGIGMAPVRRDDLSDSQRNRARYRAPGDVFAVTLRELLESTGRGRADQEQLKLFDMTTYYAGDLGLLSRRSVSVVGTRNVTSEGRARARRLAKELAAAGVVVVSGLARGVDTEALGSAIEHGGSVAAVIGTPLNKAYPAENAALQQQIAKQHLLLSPFKIGEVTFKSNFPTRNRVMAAISDATVIVEASDTSGTLHQAAECVERGRWLFILRAVTEDPSVKWPARFLGGEKTVVLDRTEQIIDALARR